MATIARQPFGVLDSARLQSLTSIKNSQNSLSPAPTSGKRKASDQADGDDFENVDPAIFSKRAKSSDDSTFTPTKGLSKDMYKSSPLSISSKTVLTATPRPPCTPSPRARPVLQAKSLTKSYAATKSSPLATTTPTPAGRSPTRNVKRSGLCSSNHRRSTNSYSRIDPPSARSSSKKAPFSLNAALKGTIPGFSGLHKSSPSSSSLVSSPASSIFSGLYDREVKSSWNFEIHEDTPQEHATNMLQHSTCVLDISSDEETEFRARQERAEGRDKENIPPADDVSQTSVTRAATRANADGMAIEKKRSALADLDVTEFYGAGCDENSVFIVPADEEAEIDVQDDVSCTPATPCPPPRVTKSEKPSKSVTDVLENAVDELLSQSTAAPAKDSSITPIEGAGEAFSIWESENDSDNEETVAAKC
ncbi:hypothetical protein TD95_001280 [Thielaviopsis punctulata]|uniref:Uncharacterized protein n=1 Tax=Thielaviopsis punctulata TaxID=72032 RepID=A0A0F4ZBV6_9PEZI|nr:hypothetical protein TD95_001280 [Thielaviopsis punctulata]